MYNSKAYKLNDKYRCNAYKYVGKAKTSTVLKLLALTTNHPNVCNLDEKKATQIVLASSPSRHVNQNMSPRLIYAITTMREIFYITHHHISFALYPVAPWICVAHLQRGLITRNSLNYQLDWRHKQPGGHKPHHQLTSSATTRSLHYAVDRRQAWLQCR